MTVDTSLQDKQLIADMKATFAEIEKVLFKDSAAKDRTGNIAKDHFVGKAILLCRKHT